MTDERRKWAHRRGDRYYLLLGEAVGNERDGFRIEHALCAQVDYSSVGEAKSAGLRTLGRSDDFNIAAVRDGHLVAVLWMDEIVDDGFDVLTEIATEVGLGLPVDTKPDDHASD